MLVFFRHLLTRKPQPPAEQPVAPPKEICLHLARQMRRVREGRAWVCLDCDEIVEYSYDGRS